MKVSASQACKAIFLILLAATFFSSCSKDSGNRPSANPATATTLLSKIIVNDPGAPNYGSPATEFVYNGKILTKAIIHIYVVEPNLSPIIFTDTVSFKYNTSNVLISTVNKYSSGSSGFTGASITANGNYIGFINGTPPANNVTTFNTSLSYQNNLLVGGLNTSADRSLNITYTKYSFAYNSSGNNTAQISEVTNQSSNVDAKDTVNTLTFDSSHNLYQALPYWEFFIFSNQGGPGFPPYIAGTNNPLAAVKSKQSINYTYTYNSDGYPTQINWNDGTAHSYVYQYIKVN